MHCYIDWNKAHKSVYAYLYHKGYYSDILLEIFQGFDGKKYATRSPITPPITVHNPSCVPQVYNKIL